MRPNAVLLVTLAAPALTALCSGCCPGRLSSPQTVNTGPLESACLPPSPHASIVALFPPPFKTFEESPRQGAPSEWAWLSTYHGAAPFLDVIVERYPSDADAAGAFERRVRERGYPRFKWLVRGAGANRSAVSDWVREREIPDVPQGLFTCKHSDPSSAVLVLRGNLFVHVEETVTDPSQAGKDPIIAWLAAVLTAGRPLDTPPPLPRNQSPANEH